MQYHVISLTKLYANVHVIAYKGTYSPVYYWLHFHRQDNFADSRPIQAIRDNASVKMIGLKAAPDLPSCQFTCLSTFSSIFLTYYQHGQGQPL
jgi:hypothetical protein